MSRPIDSAEKTPTATRPEWNNMLLFHEMTINIITIQSFNTENNRLHWPSVPIYTRILFFFFLIVELAYRLLMANELNRLTGGKINRIVTYLWWHDSCEAFESKYFMTSTSHELSFHLHIEATSLILILHRIRLACGIHFQAITFTIEWNRNL